MNEIVEHNQIPVGLLDLLTFLDFCGAKESFLGYYALELLDEKYPSPDYCDRRYKNRITENKLILPNIISTSFIWRDTLEGFVYWQTIHVIWRDYSSSFTEKAAK